MQPTDPVNQCNAANCERKVFARRMCRRHWQAWRDSWADPCSISDCDSPARSEGMCISHWSRLYKRGTTEPAPRFTIDERFDMKVDKSSGGCWIWTGARFDTGYGAFNARTRVVSAHRFAYERVHGKQPSDMHLDHLCRVRECCNPDHLELVTPRENSMRGDAPTVVLHRADVCRRGHSLVGAYVRKDTGHRMCRTCAQIRRKKAR